MCGCTLNHLYFVPSPVLVDVFLGAGHARAQTSKIVLTKCSSLTIRPATTGPIPTKVKFLHASPVNLSEQHYWLTSQLKVERGTESTDEVRCTEAPGGEDDINVLFQIH